MNMGAINNRKGKEGLMPDARSRRLTIICIFIILVMMAFLFWFTLSQNQHYTNSDVSSELMLSKILSQENTIFTNQWYYSTELRVLNSQLISSLLFRFIDNWPLIRAITN
jgi:ABC-type cobalt transport system substrate-binding protein